MSYTSHWFGTGDELKDEYWNTMWKILSEFRDEVRLINMNREFRKNKME